LYFFQRPTTAKAEVKDKREVSDYHRLAGKWLETIARVKKKRHGKGRMKKKEIWGLTSSKDGQSKGGGGTKKEKN